MRRGGGFGGRAGSSRDGKERTSAVGLAVLGPGPHALTEPHLSAARLSGIMHTLGPMAPYSASWPAGSALCCARTRGRLGLQGWVVRRAAAAVLRLAVDRRAGCLAERREVCCCQMTQIEGHRRRTQSFLYLSINRGPKTMAWSQHYAFMDYFKLAAPEVDDVRPRCCGFPPNGGRVTAHLGRTRNREHELEYD